MLTGPSISVTAAVWAELMRTRTNPDPAEAAVARIQQQTGVRIHIERSAQQIRLFGPDSNVVAGQRLLAELDSMCIEEHVVMDCPLYLDLQVLQTFAQEFGVTLQVEEKRITVLGIVGAVREAAVELAKYDNGKQQLGLEVGKPSDTARQSILKAIARLEVENCSDIFIGDNLLNSSQSAQKGGAEVPPEPMMEGAVTSKLPPPMSKGPPQHQQQSKNRSGSGGGSSGGPCPTCGSSANFCVHCGQPTEKQLGSGCPTCGALKFCVHCGQPTEKNFGNAPMGFVPAAQMYKPVAAPIPYGGEQMQLQFPQTGDGRLWQNMQQMGPTPSLVQTPEGTVMMCIPIGNQMSGGTMTGNSMTGGRSMTGGSMTGNSMSGGGMTGQGQHWMTGMFPMSFAAME